LINRIHFDNNGVLASDERFYYNGSTLVRYTKDDGVLDGWHNDEKIYDDRGYLILQKQKANQTGTSFSWKYVIDSRGLCTKKLYYSNDKMTKCLLYEYD